ncbi:MAG: hypothetical protein H8E66_16580 [Planctomycetes bacterium]|nr:hypothetical protein [Planctomycetota bacterium]
MTVATNSGPRAPTRSSWSAANVLRSASNGKEILQNADHVLRGEQTGYFKCQAFTSVLIDDDQEP